MEDFYVKDSIVLKGRERKCYIYVSADYPKRIENIYVWGVTCSCVESLVAGQLNLLQGKRRCTVAYCILFLSLRKKKKKMRKDLYMTFIIPNTVPSKHPGRQGRGWSPQSPLCKTSSNSKNITKYAVLFDSMDKLV